MNLRARLIRLERKGWDDLVGKPLKRTLRTRAARRQGTREPGPDLPDPGSPAYAVLLRRARRKEKRLGTQGLKPLERLIVRQNRPD